VSVGGPALLGCHHRLVLRAAYWDPEVDAVVETGVSEVELDDLLSAVLQHSSARGHPALEIRRPDGSSVALGTDGRRAVVASSGAVERNQFSAARPTSEIPPKPTPLAWPSRGRPAATGSARSDQVRDLPQQRALVPPENAGRLHPGHQRMRPLLGCISHRPRSQFARKGIFVSPTHAAIRAVVPTSGLVSVVEAR
jgi:hypothetical protein